MIEVGRLCVKLAGRDAGKKCIIVDILDDKFVLIDGETRRRKCNIVHLEPLNKVLSVEKNASHEVSFRVKEVRLPPNLQRGDGLLPFSWQGCRPPDLSYPPFPEEDT